MQLRKLRQEDVKFRLKQEEAIPVVLVVAEWSGIKAAAGARIRDTDHLGALNPDEATAYLHELSDRYNLVETALENLNERLTDLFDKVEPLVGKLMVSKWGGTCSVCGEDIEKGADIIWHQKSVISHERCPELDLTVPTKHAEESHAEFGNRVHKNIEKQLVACRRGSPVL